MEFSAITPNGNDILLMNTRVNIHHAEASLALLARNGGPSDEHLSACPRCRAIYEFYRLYFSEETRAFAQPVSSRDWQRAGDILSPGIYRLTPYRVHLNVQSSHPGGNAFMLAAEDGAATGSRFITIATFASDVIKAVVRVLQDRQTGSCTLHILSEDLSLMRQAEVGISDAGGQTLHVRTDEQGVSVVNNPDRIDWKTAQLLLITSPTRP